MSSNRRFGITSKINGISHGIIVNNVTLNNTSDYSQARNETGQIIDIAVYNDNKQVSIDGLFVDQGVDLGTVIKVNKQKYLVVSTGENEVNTAFKTASISARRFIDDNPDLHNPLTFKAVSGGASIALDKFGSPDTIELEYCINDGEWITYNIGDVISLNEDDTISFSGINNHFSKDFGNFYYFSMSGTIEASGNIQSLMNFSDSCTDYCYFSLFNNCSSLTKAPILKATTLASYCYGSMFYGCTSLTAAPQLLVTDLANNCYNDMFQGCTALTDAPDLSATSLANYCYDGMFNSCSNLSTITVDFTDWEEAVDSTDNWVQNVASTGIFYKPAALSTEYGDSRIPSGWQVINKETINPLTFKAVNGTAGIEIQQYGSPSAVTLYYRKNNEQWQEYNIGDSIILNQNETVSFKGPNDHFSINQNNFYYFNMAGAFEAIGNIMSLMDFSDSCTNYCFYKLFLNCTDLKVAPSLLATTLADNCYKTMFGGCTSLTSAPELPATQLKTSCYSNMFNGCSGLIAAPNLPASTLAIDCYNYMFANCTSLTDAPYLPAKTLTITCYNSMFDGCSSLSSISVEFTNWNQTYSTLNWVRNVAQTGTFTKPSGLSEEYSDNRIPTNWQVITPAPPVPTVDALSFKAVGGSANIQLQQIGTPNAIVLDYKLNDGAWTSYTVGDTINLNENDVVYLSGANNSFNIDHSNHYNFVMTGSVEGSGNIQSLMNFSDTCTSGCYYALFEHCTSLLIAPALPATGLAQDCYFDMFGMCYNLVTAPALPATTLARNCYNDMFNNCTSLTSAPALPATTLARNCYNDMFQGCTALTDAPDLSATSLANYCYQNMFAGCTNLTAVPQLPATTLADWCYSNMFYGCSKITAAPSLPATSLANYCYDEMFMGCTRLSTITVNFTDWEEAVDSTDNWVQNVASTGIFYKSSALSTVYGTNRIPSGWQVINKDEPIPVQGPLTFKAVSGGASIKVSPNSVGATVERQLLYKKNNTEWEIYSYNLDQYNVINLNEGDTISFSGFIGGKKNNTYPITYEYWRFAMSGLVEAGGNIQSVLNYSNSVIPYGCMNLFENCSSLVTAPNLPVTNLGQYCYWNMFKNCTNLSSEIYLPAYELAEGCYFGMFYGCSHLTDVVITAYDLADDAMNSMFMGCNRLSCITVYFTDWETSLSATQNWVYHVAQNGTFYKPAALSTQFGVDRIPEGWYVVEEQVEEPEPQEPPPSEQL